MTDNTPNLQLPYINPDQAQKHVTHNEALQRLDGLTQITLLDITAAPPASPASGDGYAIATGATGLWSGHDGELALYQDGYWLFTKPKRGWLAWLESRAVMVFCDGTAWSELKPAQLVLQDQLPAPPSNPVSGATYGVSAAATGAWAGHDGETAIQQAGVWMFTMQKKGSLAWHDTKSTILCFDGTSWFDLKPAQQTQQTQQAQQAQLFLQDLLSTPPANPVANATYAVMTGATGAWADHDGETAILQSGSWIFTRQKKGMLAWLESKPGTVCFDGATWGDVKISPQFETIGINTRPDVANRLSVASPASLFDHSGTSHQLKINKKGNGDTASVLFQTNYSGRAEIGLTGDNNLNFKLSPDGGTFNTWMSIDPNGVPRMPGRPICRASPNPTSISVGGTMNFGFATLSVNQGGFALNPGPAALNSGSYLQVPVTGLYLVSLVFASTSSGGSYSMTVMSGTTKVLTALQGYYAYQYMTTVTTICSLAAGDLIFLQSQASAKVDFGPGKTEISLIML